MDLRTHTDTHSRGDRCSTLEGFHASPTENKPLAGDRAKTAGAGELQSLIANKPRNQWTRKEKEHFIRENLPLSKMKLIQNRPDLQARLVAMLVDNFNCILLHKNDYGETDILEFEIKLKEGTVPRRQHPRQTIKPRDARITKGTYPNLNRAGCD